MAKFWIERGNMFAEGLVPGSLDDAVAKWEFAIEHNHYGDLLNWSNCSLCLKYINNLCVGCPVAIASEHTDCDCTPYQDYRYAFFYSGDDPCYGYKEKMKKFALEELEFLKALRDNDLERANLYIRIPAGE